MRRRISLLVLIGWAIATTLASAALPGFIKFKNGYYYDSVTGEPWVPHGIAYQTWNRPLGVWQTYQQIDYDLDEMVKMGANSIRVDFVWQHIEEDGDNQFKWSNYDYLVQAAEKRNIRIFALIGYQWPPNWFPDEWYTKHPPAADSEGIYHTNRWQSDIINYEHPEARAQYAEWFKNVCSRYATNKAIVGWIIGNESGFLGLWSGQLDGYDPECEQAFRNWCQAKYGTVSNVNARWGTGYTNFSQIVFVEQYRQYGVEGAIWADMVQWREDSIGSFTALGAKAAKAADTNHLIAYSTVGMQWGEEDWRYHAEDRGKITSACDATNAPVDFFAVNNYPWSILGHESQNGQWGISYTKKVTAAATRPDGVPVLYSETGFTSSETMWPGMNEWRQGPLVRNALWESLECGAVGTHIFAWHDRPYITDREKGFGILTPERRIKPAFWDSANAFQLMEQAKIADLLMGSKDPKPDIAFLWTAANDSQYNRYECEMQQVAGALERLGYEPFFLNLNDLGNNVFTNYKVLILPRNMRVDTAVPNSTNKPVLRFLRENVLAKGVHIMATADLPGMQDENGRPRADFTNELSLLFGVDGSDVGGFEVPPRTGTFVGDNMRRIDVTFTNAMGPLTNGYRVSPGIWKYNDEVKVNSGTVWAMMDTRRNKGFENNNTNPVQWGAWGNAAIRNGWGWQYAGTNMLHMWGDSGIYQEWDVVPFGRYTFSAWLRSNNDDALRDGAGGYLQIEWYGKDGRYLGSSESAHLKTNTPGNAWVRYAIDDLAPSNSWTMRRLVRTGPDNMLANGQLTGSGLAPTGWSQWGDTSHDPCTEVYAGTSGNSWQFWWDGGIFQDFTSGFAAGDLIKFGGYLYTPINDRLRNGTKYGTIQVEFYNGSTLLSTATAQSNIWWGTTNDVWTRAYAEATVPAGANLMRFVIRCNDSGSGDGKFMADDVFLKNGSRGGGALYVDNTQENPALVVKNHGTAKAAIFLFTAGDIASDGDGDDQMDILPWKWRYDYFGAVVRDYFGVQPLIRLIGTNASYCMAEYRTCTNGSTLWQIKNYLYDRFAPNGAGGGDMTFTIQSTLFTGRTIRAFEQGRILETNSDGIITITLPPDGHDMLLAYLPGTNRKEVVQVAAAPSVVHPGGDRVFYVKALYDCASTTNLRLKVAFKEAGDNGDGITNELYAVQTNAVTGAGSAEFWLWIPFFRQGDTDYKSTPDGGKYEFAAWLETAGAVKVAQAVPRSTMLEWGVRPTAAVATNMTKGGSTTVPIEWEELYEPLSWENTPLTRNASYPTRIAVLRSSKTETQYPGHFTRVNEVSDWLDSLGYVAGNPLDISFDNITVSGLFSDNFEDGNYTGWSRVAGCANVAVQTAPMTHGKALNYDKNTTFALSATNRRLSFKIVADQWKYVDKVYVYARVYGTSPVYRLNICKDKAGVPDMSAVVGTATFTVPSTTFTWVAVDVPNFQWSAGSTYHLVMSHASGTINTARYAAVQYVGPNSPDRKVVYSTNGGSTWTQQAYEPAFRILYTDGTSFTQPYASYSSIANLGATRYGQQFILPEAMTMTNLALFIRKDATVAGDVRVQIRKWSNKAVVATATVTRATVKTTNSWINFRFNPAVVLGGSTQYFFEVINLGVTGNYYVVRDNALGSYGGYTWDGTANATVYSLNTGATWTAQTHYDIGFVLSGSTSNKAVRMWRIGNSDNIMAAAATYTNCTLSANIRYNKQDNYFDDAEIYFHYKDRANYYRVGIRNYYAFWRLKYTVMAQSNIIAQGWLYDFAKTNRPVENAWYNLKIVTQGSTNQVFFNDKPAGVFWATNVPSGRIAFGSRAIQLGNWEPQKGYYYVDDDEWSFWAPEGQAQTRGRPTNLDAGYLNGFFNTMIFPSVYVMSDIEVSNVIAWATNAMNSLIVFDGGLAMKNDAGAFDLGRIESLLGVASATRTMSNVTSAVVGTKDHYVTLDYAPGAAITAKGGAMAYTTPTAGTGLGTLQNATSSAPAYIANVIMAKPETPVKVFCFNYSADTQGQLTNEARKVAQRAFEWTRGDAFKCRVQLMFDTQASDPKYDIVVFTTNIWVLTGSGSNTISVTLPTDGIMTGTNLYWSITMYPWDLDPWNNHAGFYSSDLDNRRVRLPGKGLQVLGAATNVWAGREWGIFLAYNTDGSNCLLTYGLKDKGNLLDEDNFDDGNYTGWAVQSHPNIAWSVTNGNLRASVVSTGGYSYIYRQGLALGVTNVTFEYDTRFMNGARHGGAIYRGVVLYANPQLCGWVDDDRTYVTNGTGITTGKWHHVVIKVRDGAPYMRSDLIVDGKAIFLDEAINVSAFSTNTVGFLSPYVPGYVEWNNVRVSDEQYTVITQAVNGVYYPTSDITPHVSFAPDYDPAMWEHEGSAMGAKYEWYAYLNGQGCHGAQDTEVYFAPRIMTEDTNFPAIFNPGQTVNLPVEWERLPELPMRLTVTLQDAWNGHVYATNTVNMASASGTALVPIAVPEQTPSGAGYSWGTMMYPTNVPDPWQGRLGADDTFRYGLDGLPVEPEIVVNVSSIVGGDFVLYRDSGIADGVIISTWAGGATTFNGDYVGGTPPEGTKCFLTDGSSWAGWGVISTNPTGVNMSEYRDGFLRFWLKSTTTVKVDIEQVSGAKGTIYVPTTAGVWKEIILPVSSFTGITLTQIKGLFEITAETATTFYVDHVRFVKGIFNVYRDAGIPAKSRLTNWASGAAVFNAHYTDGAAPEGYECYQATSAVSAGWGVVMTNGTLDMTIYTNGFLTFAARSTVPLKVELEGPAGTRRSATVASTTGTWKEISVPLSSFNGINLAQVYGLFRVTATNGTTFLVDDVRWEKGTNAVPSEQKETFYSDAGLKAGSDVMVWWASTYWSHISSTYNDGGFESDANGLFPNSGFWNITYSAAGATSLCSTAAARSGTLGLREQTGSGTTAYSVSTWQEYLAYAGDILGGQAYVRQPTGSTWVAGSTAFVRMQFLDAWRAVITNYSSSVKVTTAGQGWSLCSISQVTAPFATRYVRLELVTQKPSASNGVSVADFDDAWLGQYNSFYGNFAEDPTPPEGTKTFRSYCVSWSGWGIFYTNTVTNLSQYAGGYLKFWYKSPGSTKIEIQSAWAGVTNKAAYPSVGYFGPTLNESGQLIWKQFSIPISYFAGVDLAHIKSPFMVTDPQYDQSFCVDDVRWTMSP